MTVCGSLQARSANRAALDAAVAKLDGVVLDDFDRLAEIPAFDGSDDGGQIVGDWRRRIAEADVVLFAVPEYAGGMAGGLKNALDWVVGSGELYRKPVGLISAGTSGGFNARRSAAQTLSWQGAYVVADLGIAAPRTKFDADGSLQDTATASAIAALTRTVVGAPDLDPDGLVARVIGVLDALDVDTAHVPPALHPTS